MPDYTCWCDETFKNANEYSRHKKGGFNMMPCLKRMKGMYYALKDTEGVPSWQLETVKNLIESCDLFNRYEKLVASVSESDVPVVELDVNKRGFTMEGDAVGFIYLIREREFVRCGEPVYKVGMTIQEVGDSGVRRLNAYKKGTELIFLWQCMDPTQTITIETIIKKRFQELFRQHDDGHEYFMGDRFEMVDTIMKVIGTANVNWKKEGERIIENSLVTEARDLEDKLYIVFMMCPNKVGYGRLK